MSRHSADNASFTITNCRLMPQDAHSTCLIPCGRPILPPHHHLSTQRKEIATMNKPEGRADHLVSPVAQTAAGGYEDTMTCLPNDNPIILTIRDQKSVV